MANRGFCGWMRGPGCPAGFEHSQAAAGAERLGRHHHRLRADFAAIVNYRVRDSFGRFSHQPPDPIDQMGVAPSRRPAQALPLRALLHDHGALVRRPALHEEHQRDDREENDAEQPRIFDERMLACHGARATWRSQARGSGASNWRGRTLARMITHSEPRPITPPEKRTRCSKASTGPSSRGSVPYLYSKPAVLCAYRADPRFQSPLAKMNVA